MGKRREPMSEGKKNIIASLIQEHDIKTALLKALYLATFEVVKKWSLPIRNWGKVYEELFIMYEDRLP
ncbi:MAG: hypothetical protein ACM3XR_09405 [Bacillota bacterium]